ncbi:hypothetical protein [[Mycoplasma] collis]|uniref:hypothetical protein n=1 Tax=[Mycoplasma] collis TaxID=2127 RepID=UPI00051B9536|nr:hypothetical protein [[Mycoplasma] collis]
MIKINLPENLKNNLETYKEEILKEAIRLPKFQKIIKREKITLQEAKDNISYFIQAMKKNSEYEIDLVRNDEGKLKPIYSVKKNASQFKKNFWLTEITEINFDNVEKIEKSIDSNRLTKNLNSFYYQKTLNNKENLFDVLAVKIAKSSNKSIAFINTNDLMFYTFDKAIKDNSLFAFINKKFKEVDILFLDDIGSENDSNWFLNSLLIPILKYRDTFEKVTYFSSYYSLNNLHKAYSDKKVDLLTIKKFVSVVESLSIKKYQKDITNDEKQQETKDEMEME